MFAGKSAGCALLCGNLVLAVFLGFIAGCGDDVYCPEGLSWCWANCVDLGNDEDNCGSCDNTCESYQSCIEGVCSCEGGYSDCGSSCANLNFDAANCGSCGRACCEDETYLNDTCTIECPSGSTVCHDAQCGYCADLSWDEAHCGTCDNRCNQDQLCYFGECLVVEFCADYFDCGFGSYCREEGICWTDCSSDADCEALGSDTLCNPFGQCLIPGEQLPCQSHQDCGIGRYCNSVCSISGASCVRSEDCPMDGATCSGTCSTTCRVDEDCPDVEWLECSPVNQCLRRGWEKWFPVGLLPPADCDRDSQCQVLGWRYVCDCQKEVDPHSGLELCVGGVRSACVALADPIDFGNGPAGSPANLFRGTWAMRQEIAVKFVGIPLVSLMNVYFSSLSLVKISHFQDDTVEILEKTMLFNC